MTKVFVSLRSFALPSDKISIWPKLAFLSNLYWEDGIAQRCGSRFSPNRPGFETSKISVERSVEAVFMPPTTYFLNLLPDDFVSSAPIETFSLFLSTKE